MAALIVARVLIGIGASGGYSSAMLLIHRRAVQLGLDQPSGGVLGGLQIVATATTALGLPIGGEIADALGWRATFLVNVPVTLLALGLSAAWLPRDPAIDSTLSARAVIERVDLAGALLFPAAMISGPNGSRSRPPSRLRSACWGASCAPRQPFLDARLLAANLTLTRTYLRFG